MKTPRGFVENSLSPSWCKSCCYLKHKRARRPLAMTQWSQTAPSPQGLFTTGQAGAMTSPQARLCLNSSSLECWRPPRLLLVYLGVGCILIWAFNTSCSLCSGFSPRFFTALKPHNDGFFQNKTGYMICGFPLRAGPCAST